MTRTVSHHDRSHRERHAAGRVQWLRAAVLGANDGLVSVASLLVGVAAAETSSTVLLATGVAAVSSGALSMAVGEYVSVSSQRDAEHADIAREQHELEHYPEHELDELTGIYVSKGLEPELARTVAEKLSEHDRLGAHLIDELGITEQGMARPVQASLASAASFTVGALVPFITVLVAPVGARIATVAVLTLLALAVLGALGARVGGASAGRPTLRVLIGGGLAMAATALIGHLVGVATG
jgi:VIT1/CCC1 family predicted Fe2+/Mn2+ transporter